MPWQDGTLTDEDVALELGVPVDDRVEVATDTARAWAEAHVSVSPSELWSDPARHRGGVLEGCYQYQRRADPQGMPAYDDLGSDTWTLHRDAERLIRPDPVIA